jgi:UrcA family protein
MQPLYEHQNRVINHRKAQRRLGSLSWFVWLFLVAGPASATLAAPTSSETIGVRVPYNRAKLSSPAAARSLLKRIGGAALESCGASPFSLVELKAATLQSQCWKEAVDDAVRRIDSPVLSAAAGASR